MFCKPDGTITVRSFDAIIRQSDGEALVSSTDFISVEPVEVFATVVSRFVFEASGVHTALNVGDEIEVYYGGFSSLNTVNKVSTDGLKYEVSEKLPITTPGIDISFKSVKNTVTFLDIEEGFYYFESGDRGNEQLIVRNTWMKPYIGYQELTASFSDASTIEDGRIQMLNEQAWEEIYCDLSALGDAYDLLYGSDIRTLQKYKILSILENDFENESNKRSFSDIYDRYLNKFSLNALAKLEADSTGKPTGEITQIDSRFSL